MPVLENIIKLLEDLDDEFDCGEIITTDDELDVLKHAVHFLLNREYHFGKKKKKPLWSKFIEGVVECNLREPFPDKCKKRNGHSEECKHCQYNNLNWDEGSFFASFLKTRQFNPLEKPKWKRMDK